MPDPSTLEAEAGGLSSSLAGHRDPCLNSHVGGQGHIAKRRTNTELRSGDVGQR